MNHLKCIKLIARRMKLCVLYVAKFKNLTGSCAGIVELVSRMNNNNIQYKQQIPLPTSERGLSLSNHLQIFINCRSAQITNPREFAHIHLTCDSPINNQSFYCTMFRCKNKKAMVFRPPLYQKMYPICSAIVEKMPVKSVKMFCFRLQVSCYNAATKYVPLLRCTTLSCFRALFAAV